MFAAAHAGRGAALAPSGGSPSGWAARSALVNTVNPERVLLGGTFTEVLRLARPELEAAVGRYAFEGSPARPS